MRSRQDFWSGVRRSIFGGTRTPSSDKRFYVLLFSDPKGDPDRRLKGTKGPFRTKLDADRYAESQKEIWYPRVVFITPSLFARVREAPGHKAEDVLHGAWKQETGYSARDERRGHKTFAKARAELLEHLKARGWDVKTWGPQGPLKTPHATSPSGTVRLWFKPQAVYVSWGRHHEMGNARSLWVDIRTTSPDDVVRQAEKWEPGYSSSDTSHRTKKRRTKMAGRPKRRRLLARLRRDMEAVGSDPGRRRRRRHKRRHDPEMGPERDRGWFEKKPRPRHAKAGHLGWVRVAETHKIKHPKTRSWKKEGKRSRASHLGWERVARSGKIKHSTFSSRFGKKRGAKKSAKSARKSHGKSRRGR